MQVVIWGAGNCFEIVLENILDDAIIEYVVDSDTSKQGLVLCGKIRIISPKQLLQVDYDILVVSVIKDQSIEKEIRELGIPMDKVIFFWRDHSPASLVLKNRMMVLHEERHRNKLYKARLDSVPYELGLKRVPIIKSAQELLIKIEDDKSSLCRFGDGEFEIMLGRNRAWFQQTDCRLADRLNELINCNDKRINIAIAQNFIELTNYKEAAADEIRIYMEGSTRTEIINLLHADFYYDAYVSRPYIIYKDRSNADMIFPLWKKIWAGRKVIIVEGEKGRTGIGNDLFAEAESIKRIVCPAQNAWSRYDEIHETVRKIANPDDLICISLGPAATVLAYDLAVDGIQALDIGQLDNEYDWYIRGADCKSLISDKFVAEVSGNALCQNKPEEYLKQVIRNII